MKLKLGWRPLLSVCGIGETLALTSRMETGRSAGFRKRVTTAPTAVRSTTSQDSNGRKKGKNTAWCGNRYWVWAYLDEANFAARDYPQTQAFVGRRTAETNRTLGIVEINCAELERNLPQTASTSTKFERCVPPCVSDSGRFDQIPSLITAGKHLLLQTRPEIPRDRSLVR